MTLAQLQFRSGRLDEALYTLRSIKPTTLSMRDRVWVQYLTAWQLLVVMGSLSSGETVLIHNAGGGVGLAAIDIARHIGATIFGTARTPCSARVPPDVGTLRPWSR